MYFIITSRSYYNGIEKFGWFGRFLAIAWISCLASFDGLFASSVEMSNYCTSENALYLFFTGEAKMLPDLEGDLSGFYYATKVAVFSIKSLI